MKYKVGVLGLAMGHAWAKAAHTLPDTELAIVYDPAWGEYHRIDEEYYIERKIKVAKNENEVYASDADIIIVASPDHFHAEQCIKSLKAGKHTIAEKPLAPTVEDCRGIIKAVRESGKSFMTGQVCRYAPGFRTAKQLLDEGRIGEICSIESEYAHNYEEAKGCNNWRCDAAIKRQGFLGGGCHALDLVRWLAGDPEEVFCYMNRKQIPSWPTPDTGIAVAKFKNNVIGRVFVSVGVKRPYTMRTVINGTKGTIICDNTSPFIQISEKSVCETAQKLDFSTVPVTISSHNVDSELSEFTACLKAGKKIPTDVIEGTKTVAFAEAAIKSAETGLPVKVVCDF